MQPNYLFYPKILQQGGNNFGSAVTDMNDQRRVKPEFFYQPYSKYAEEKTCSYKFLQAFSHLPCLPSGWSQPTRGAIGFGIFLFFISLIIVALGLIPVYLTLNLNFDKNEFSIDVSNGLRLQNQNLLGILSQTNEANRTLDQNITLTNEINNLVTQLTARFRSLNPNLEKIYNLRLNPDIDQSINVSYSIKTKPLTKSEITEFQNKLSSIINDQTNFIQLALNNSTILVNPNSNDIKLSDPVVGEFKAKSSILLSNSKSSFKSNSESMSLGIDKKQSDLSKEQKLIQSYSKIKFIKDDDDYMKKYPIYFPSYEPNYPPNEYQGYPDPYTEPYYPQEYNQYTEPNYQTEYSQKYEKKTKKYGKYSKESYSGKESEYKKKQKSKLKDEKTVLKSETANSNSTKTEIKLKDEKSSVEIIDNNESELDDSIEVTTKKSEIKEQKKEDIKLKVAEKSDQENIIKLEEKTNQVQIEDSDKKSNDLDDSLTDKNKKLEKLISSTKEIKITEKEKN